MLRKINETIKEDSNRNEKTNRMTQTLVKLTILIAVVLLQVGFQADMGLAAGRTTLVYEPVEEHYGVPSQQPRMINLGQLHWTYDHQTPPRDGFPIVNIWNGK